MVVGWKEVLLLVFKVHSAGHPFNAGNLRCKRTHTEPGTYGTPERGGGVRKTYNNNNLEFREIQGLACV